MAIFNYTVADKTGKLSKGELEAVSQRAALAKLRQRNLLVVDVQEQIERAPFWQGIISEPRVAELDKAMFVRHLAILTRAGLTLVEALAVLAKQPPSARMGRIIKRLAAEVDKGKSLGEGMKLFPRNFSGLITSMVEVGERSGSMDQSLDYLADQLEKNYELKKKVRGAMIYPLVILSFIILLSVGLVGFILPRIVPMFESLNVDLPAPTRALIAVMNFFSTHGILAGVAGVAIIIGSSILMRMPSLRPMWHAALLRLPFFGSFSRDINLTKFSRTMEAMLKSGTPIVRSLEVTGHVLSNQRYQAAVNGIGEQVKKGSALAAALINYRTLFPVIMTAMVQVGEASGTLEDILNYLGRFYGERVDTATRGLAGVVGPLMLIIMGVLVGGVAIAIILPIYQLPGSFVK